jgi:hypothetical protein
MVTFVKSPKNIGKFVWHTVFEVLNKLTSSHLTYRHSSFVTFQFPQPFAALEFIMSHEFNHPTPTITRSLIFCAGAMQLPETS